jgi:plasmid stabilization system protein ParE
MKKYIISALAEHDMEEIVGFIALDNKVSGIKMLDNFYSAFDLLSSHPQMGHVRPDFTDHEVRLKLKHRLRLLEC